MTPEQIYTAGELSLINSTEYNPTLNDEQAVMNLVEEDSHDDVWTVPEIKI